MMNFNYFTNLKTIMTQNLITIIEQDINNEGYIKIPESILVDLQWFENQKLTIEVQEDGSVLLRRLIEKTIIQEEERIYV